MFVNSDRRAPSALSSITTVWVLLALLIPFLVAATNPLEDDIWWTLKLGELIAAGHGLEEEVLTFPPHAEGYVNAQWLAQLWYHSVERLLGLEGIPFINALQLVAAFGLVLHLAWRRSGDMRVAAVCTMAGALIAATNFNPRAQTLALLFFAATAWLLHAPGRPALRLLAIGAIAALWANVHGSFWLGPALAVLLWPVVRTRFLPMAVAVQLAASLLNPHGAEIFRYVITVVANPVVRGAITEWQPPAFSDLSGGAFYCSLLATAALVLWRRTWLQTIPLLVFAVLGLFAVRNLVWWAVIAPPVWASCIRVGTPTGRSVPILNAGLIVMLLGLMACSTPWTKELNPLLPGGRRAVISMELPREAADYLVSAGASGRVFAYQPWGGYLEWRFWPRHQLMVDGRIELRPPEVWDDYARTDAGDPAWRRRLARYDVRVLVLSRRHQEALVARLAEAGISPVHKDRVATVYITGQQ